MKWIKVKKKPVEVEAFQLTEDMAKFCIPYSIICTHNNRRVLGIGREFKVETIEGVMNARVGDWIIKGIKGELYPCKSDIFEETYEEVSEDDN